MSEQFTLLEARVTGEVIIRWPTVPRDKSMPVEVNKGSIRFVGFKPTKAQIKYYATECGELVYYSDEMPNVKNGDKIRVHMHPFYIAQAKQIEVIGRN